MKNKLVFTELHYIMWRLDWLFKVNKGETGPEMMYAMVLVWIQYSFT